MGADGGLVLKRSEVVKVKPAGSEGEREEPQRDTTLLWSTCALSSEPLADPVVSDCTGKLYNKKSILELLLGVVSRTRQCSHIRHLRDVAEVSREIKTSLWVDPISGNSIEKESQSKAFGQIVECGHVLPIQLLEGADGCAICEASFSSYVILNPSTEKSRNHNSARSRQLAKDSLSHSLRSLGKGPARRAKRPAESPESRKRKQSRDSRE